MSFFVFFLDRSHQTRFIGRIVQYTTSTSTIVKSVVWINISVKNVRMLTPTMFHVKDVMAHFNPKHQDNDFPCQV